jgi:hypothetical protein
MVDIDKQIVKAFDNPQQLKILREERRKIKWMEFTRPALRSPVLTAGILTRVEGLTKVSKVQAFDSYIAMAAGVDIWDFSATAHYLKYLSDDKLPRDAISGSIGAFIDLSDDPPPPVLGLSIGYGYYRYNELHSIVPTSPEVSVSPNARRLDLILSISGAPDSGGGATAGIGFRVTRLIPSARPAQTIFSVVFSSNIKVFD